MVELLEGRYFKTFIAVLEEKSFSRAADRLGYVQSTVTTHIKLLEGLCNQKLFHRVARGVIPTEAGLKLEKYANQYIRLGNCIQEEMSDLDQARGTVSLRVQESFFLTRMTELIQFFINEHPLIKLRIESGFNQNIIDKVLNHGVDFGIVPRDPQRHEVLFYPLVQEKLILVASNHLSQEVESDGLHVLNNQTLISFGTSCLYHSQSSKVLEEEGILTADALELPSLEMIKQSVKQGIGFAMIPEVSVKEELESGEFKSLQLSTELSSLHGLIVNKDRELSYAAKLFRNAVLDYYNVKPPTF
ncbi:LysR family transcriptional regulator [Paenibacillus polysaccharolyticus]|uniref:LysR family transcriptional regulator n=1 Tax=Paenibacillus polysaccharolyticus TaxID=582692 RepID=UPI00209F0298|nr:LysR family transcriptional regulator [Paenibacillus polysaccharolyticus]